jgi:hypothetical protein
MQLKHRHHAKLVRGLEAKKDAVENAIQRQIEHDVRFSDHLSFEVDIHVGWQQARETKLAQMRGVTVAWGEPMSPKLSGGDVGLPGQSGPAVENNGHAVGYGADYNHTTVDSEGNPQGGQNYKEVDVNSPELPGHFQA